MSQDAGVEDIVGGPGWIISGANLQPKITDLAEFREAFKDDPLVQIIENMWLGNPEEALSLLRQCTSSFRVNMLNAQCLIDLGRFEEGIKLFTKILEHHLGTSKEATIRQHLGKGLLCAKRIDEAYENIYSALKLREAASAPKDLIESSLQAKKYIELYSRHVVEGAG